MPSRLAMRLRQELQVFPVIATEIEFYLHHVPDSATSGALQDFIWQAAADAHIELAVVAEERALWQYEAALFPYQDMEALCDATERFKQALVLRFARQAIAVDFAAKPFPDLPGSGLHVHVHLEDHYKERLYFKGEQGFSAQLLHSLGGLLALLPACMIFFAPHEASYLRFVPDMHAPLTKSWGPNNRTVALRLPQKPETQLHLEHRVSGADADPRQVIRAVLAGIHYGLSEAIPVDAPTYGNAALPAYGLPRLPKSLEEARSAFQAAHAVLRLYDLYP